MAIRAKKLQILHCGVLWISINMVYFKRHCIGERMAFVPSTKGALFPVCFDNIAPYVFRKQFRCFTTCARYVAA